MLATAFVPLKFELGDAFQFDWREEVLVVVGICYRMEGSIPRRGMPPSAVNGHVSASNVSFV